ncbi:MAG: sensor histidine kinase [Bacillota bacterium]|nr:MAG: sensor histidine kinase [Bacillota bacterium]
MSDRRRKGGEAEAQARLVRDLERRLAEQTRVNAELAEALRAMELRALQAQVNPHFLFNTLSSIAACSFMEEAPRTNDLVQALARLLRYTLRQIGQMVDLEEELRHVRDYLLIEKARFGSRVNVLYDVDPAALPARLPLLTLQPLVENAIIHGLEGQDRGTVRVSARREGEWVRVEIADDGAGMDQETARAVTLRPREGAGITRVTGLGLANVHRRLEHAFGEGSGLSVESRLGRGTKVTVHLPFSRPEPAADGPSRDAPGIKAGEES